MNNGASTNNDQPVTPTRRTPEDIIQGAPAVEAQRQADRAAKIEAEYAPQVIALRAQLADQLQLAQAAVAAKATGVYDALTDETWSDHGQSFPIVVEYKKAIVKVRVYKWLVLFRRRTIPVFSQKLGTVRLGTYKDEWDHMSYDVRLGTDSEKRAECVYVGKLYIHSWVRNDKDGKQISVLCDINDSSYWPDVMDNDRNTDSQEIYEHLERMRQRIQKATDALLGMLSDLLKQQERDEKYRRQCELEQARAESP